MKKKLVASSIAVALIGGAASQSFGSGFKVSEQGAKAMGMANSFAAQADDPSALAYNPAGIAFQKGSQVQVGDTSILVPQTEFEGNTRLSLGSQVSEKANRDIFIVPTLYATTSLKSIPLSFGLGVNSFNPLAKRWDAGSSFRDSIQSLTIKTVNFQPTVAYRFDDLNLSIAYGVDVTYAQVSQQKLAYADVPRVSAYSSLAGTYQELGVLGSDTTATGYGHTFGAKWIPSKELSFGASYRTEVKLGLNGDATFVRTGSNATALGFTLPTVKTSASTDITLPASMILGVAWKPIDALTLEFDAEKTWWHSFNKLEYNYGAPLDSLNGMPDAKNWQDVWAYRFGVQYALNKNIDLRAGYAYDTSPVPNSTLGPELPDADRHNFSVGTGFHNDYGSIDLAYLWVHWVDRTVSDYSNLREAGTFKSDAQIMAASVTLKF